VKRNQVVCATCGSADVQADAYARWNVLTQQWDLSSTLDDTVCEVCEGECKTEEIPFDDWQKSITETQHLFSPHLGLEVEVGIEQLGDDEDKWVAVVSESDVGEIFRGEIIWSYPDKAKDAARRWVMNEREIF
jgi:hypothetical protein